MRRNRTRHLARARRGFVESLEKRLLLSNTWKAAVSGDWDDPTKWSLGHVPTSTEDAVIGAGSFTVTHSTSAIDSVHSLTSSAAFTMSSGTLKIGTTLQINNTFTLSGGTISGGTVKAGAGGQGITAATPAGGELVGSTIAANISIPDGTTLMLGGNTTLQNSTITITSNGSQAQLLLDSYSSMMTLGGTGSIVFAGSVPASARVLSGNGAGPSTIGAGITIHGKGGTLY